MALHGGEAIAGAINIVLRRDYEGFEIQAGIERPGSPGGVFWDGAGGRGHLMIALDAFLRREIRSANREYSRASWTPGGAFADTAGVSIGGNTPFIPTASGPIARPLGGCSGHGYAGSLLNPVVGIPGAGYGFAYADIMWETAHFKWQSLFVYFDHPLGADAALYFDARVGRGDNAFRYAPSVGQFVFTPSQELKDRILDDDPELEAVPNRLFVAHRFIDHGNRDWRSNLEEHDLMLGVRGQLPASIGYDVHLRTYRFEEVEHGNTFVSKSESEIRQAIAEGRYDPENPPSTASEHLAAIRETALRLDHHHGVEHRIFRLSLDGAASHWPAATCGGRRRLRSTRKSSTTTAVTGMPLFSETSTTQQTC